MPRYYLSLFQTYIMSKHFYEQDFRSLSPSVYCPYWERIKLQRLRANRLAFEEKSLEHAAEQARFVEVPPPKRLRIDREYNEYEVIEHQDCVPSVLDDYEVLDTKMFQQEAKDEFRMPKIIHVEVGMVETVSEYIISLVK